VSQRTARLLLVLSCWDGSLIRASRLSRASEGYDSRRAMRLAPEVDRPPKPLSLADGLYPKETARMRGTKLCGACLVRGPRRLTQLLGLGSAWGRYIGTCSAVLYLDRLR
jgi:hypothetical protein